MFCYEKTLRGAEFVGEIVANVFGMNDSQFQWVVDAMKEDAEREAQKKKEDAQRAALAKARAAAKRREARQDAEQRADAEDPLPPDEQAPRDANDDEPLCAGPDDKVDDVRGDDVHGDHRHHASNPEQREPESTGHGPAPR